MRETTAMRATLPAVVRGVSLLWRATLLVVALLWAILMLVRLGLYRMPGGRKLRKLLAAQLNFREPLDAADV